MFPMRLLLRRLLASALMVVALAFAAGCAGTSAPINPDPAAPTATLSATPTSVTAGGAVTLTWSTSNANSVTIDQGIGTVLASGQRIVSPASTTIYTLTASGAGGNTTATTTVTVTSTPQPTAPTVTSFAAMPASVSPGQTAKLTWTTANATTVTIDQGIGSKPPSGEIDVTPTSTTTYTLVANGTNGQSSPATATVTVSTGSGLSRINHILLFQQENRSFDQYFGKLDDYRVREFSLPKGQVDGIPDNASNPLFEVNQDGSRKEVGTVKPYHLRTACVDNTSPAWNEAYTQRWRNRPACAPGSCDPLDPAPPMDGFTFTATGYAYKNIEWDINGVRAMGYYTEQDLPYYYFMATQFATSNRWFSPVLTRTPPNLMYSYAGTSAGYITRPASTDPTLPQTTIFDLLEENGISWKVYQPEPANNALGHFRIYSRFIGTKIVPIEQYYEDLKNGTLPQVAYIHSHAAGLDEHPGGDMPNRPADPTSDDFRERCTWQPPILDPAKDNNDPTKYDVTKWQSGDKPRLNCGIHIQYGARYSSEIINALMNSSAWKDSVFVWTFDESGGIYDHVPPQRAVPPDDIAPRFATDPPDTPGGFHITGGRIPIMVISPFTKKHYVSNTVMDTTAVLKLIQERFGLPSLTKRDAAQASMQEFFDFENPPWLTPPTPPEQPITLPCDRARLP